jgi:hypothetical protein
MLKNGWWKILPMGVLAAQLALGGTTAALEGREAWEGMPAVADHELDEMRGGYVDREGVRVLFGIEQAVFVDGVLQAVTRLNIGYGLEHLAAMPPMAGADGRFADSSTQLSLAAGGDLFPNRFLTVVQNTEDQRVIDTLTRIDTVVHGLNALRDNRTLQTLQSQMIDSLR